MTSKSFTPAEIAELVKDLLEDHESRCAYHGRDLDPSSTKTLTKRAADALEALAAEREEGWKLRVVRKESSPLDWDDGELPPGPQGDKPGEAE